MWLGFDFRTPFLTVIYLHERLVHCWLSSGHVSDSSASSNTSRHLGSPSGQPVIQSRRVYTTSRLKALRKVQPKQHLCKDLWQKLGDLGVRKKFTSKRGGKKQASPCEFPVVDNYIGILQQSNHVTTITKRQRMLARFGSHSASFKLWRNKVANAISTCKQFSFYNNKAKNLKNTNIRRWWSEIKTSREFRHVKASGTHSCAMVIILTTLKLYAAR